MRKLLMGLFFFWGAGAAWAQSVPHLSLAALQHVSFPEVVLNSVTHVTPKKPARTAPYVDVKGVIGGHIHFELLLPDKWNGRLIMGGGGGFVGSVQNPERGAVNSGYATVGTDTGHQQSGLLARWAYNNLEAQLNFGYLAVHRTAVVAKALVRTYYRAAPAYSYFVGCSRGGGQAMMESQRYPGDFNGIVAGAPAFDWTGLAAMMVRVAQVMYPNPRDLKNPVLSQSVLEKLHQAVLQQCDGQDGLRDGIIGDPPSAHFDLSKVPGLTAAQRKAIETIYQGVRSNGQDIYPGYSLGSEDPSQWRAWLVGPLPGLLAQIHAPDLTFDFGVQCFKYLFFNDPKWNYATYNFSHFQKDSHLAATFLNAVNPNLNTFKARHGKLILWQGWADPALPPQALVNYYRRVLQHDPKADRYCRLFMIPGCAHCGGGPGASNVNWLAVISAWVEHGQVPGRIIASKSGLNGKVIMTRPLYPYPKYAMYKGRGDPNNAANFIAKSAEEPTKR